MKKAVKKFKFTLVELLVSMGVFTIMMLALMQFFNSAQKLWTSSEKRVGTFGDARVAMNLMSTMLQTAFYENDGNTPSLDGKVPFYSKEVNDSYDEIAFVTDASFVLDETCESRIYEVGFTVVPSEDNKLKIRYVGDKNRTTYPTGGWNFYGGTEINRLSDLFAASLPAYVEKEEIIPYVMELKFTCLRRDGTTLASGSPLQVDAFPYAVMIKMSLLDKITYSIWKEKAGGGTINNPITAGSADVQEYLNNNKRTFTTIVYIGDRGQENL